MNTNNEDDEIEISLSHNNTGGSSWASFGEHHISDVADPSALNPASPREGAAVGAPSRPLGTISKKSKVIVGITAGVVFLVALSVGIIMGRTKETEQSTTVVSLSKCLERPEYEEYKAYAINDTPTYVPTYSPTYMSTRDDDTIISNDLTLPWDRRRRNLAKLSPSDTAAESSNEAAIVDKSEHRRSRLGLMVDTLTKKKLDTRIRANLNENNENASTSNRIRKRYLNNCADLIFAAYGSKSSTSSDRTRSSKWSQSKSAKDSTASPSQSPETSSPSKSPATDVPGDTSSPTTSRPTGPPRTSTPTDTPSQSPVTSSPTTSNPTVSPNQSPVTSSPSKSPSQSPITSSPTTPEPTVSPSQSPVTSSPTNTPSQSPITSSPTTPEPTVSPSQSPETSSPSKNPTPDVPGDTSSPTTSRPTRPPRTSTPTDTPSQSPATSSPTTSEPTVSPSQSPVTSSPTTPEPTVSPSQSPETSSPSKSPSQSPVTSSPTTPEPTVSPSQSPETSSPTNAPSQSPVTSSPTTPTPDVPEDICLDNDGADCICGQCASNTCVFAPGSQRPLALALRWIGTGNAPSTIYYEIKCQGGGAASRVLSAEAYSVKVSDSEKYDPVFFIYNDVCEPVGNSPSSAPYGLGNNLEFYSNSALSNPLLAELHASCSNPIFISQEIGPNTNNLNNHECDNSSPPVCTVTNPTFEIIGACSDDSIDGCEGYIKEGWPSFQ